jgi:hypothetical protein
MAVAPWIVSDELWGLVEPLLPKRERRFRYPGRKRMPDRQALQGVLFVLHTGISWTHGVDLEALAEVGERVADITDGAASAGQGRRLTLICEAGRVELPAGRVALTAHGSRTRVASATPSPLSSLRYRFNPPKEQ